jgi:prolipoprotein diacylglyceryl transferase
MIALGVMAAVWLTNRRVEARKIATSDDIASIAYWGVPAGVIGGRLYHVITDWERFRGHYFDIIKIWQGGLGIWGGIALGVGVGLWRAHLLKLPIGAVLNCAVPGIALAQAIGRWGHWFNQELFGKPTTLPWALEVSTEKARAAGYSPGTTFHPTFLYESIACVAICLVLVLIDKRFTVKPGRLLFVYAGLYTVFRFFIEGLRIDPAHTAGGLRLNQWTSIVVFTTALSILVLDRFIGTSRTPRVGGEPSTVDDHE